VFTDPTFNPQIGEFQLSGGKAVLRKTIVLKAPDGTPYNGLPVPITKTAASAEKTEDLWGNQIDPTQPYTVPGTTTTLNPDDGYDSEGLVAMRDGTFWVSDEYGPFITGSRRGAPTRATTSTSSTHCLRSCGCAPRTRAWRA
jgi:hypothetical protein